ncbi:MAG: transglycosylase domain-containing protein [Clostridia bacterium]|nr:transglycosylase domain-containing protein [Clostridia bacterium]
MKYIKRIFAILILTVSIIVGIVFYQGYDLYKNAISKLSIEQMVKDIRNQENFCTIDELPDDYINAVIAVEDRRFYKHNGIDIISIGRAVVTDIKEMAFVEGGSTITQQIAKNNLFTQEKKATRKIAEIFAARDLEKYCTKDEIFELYVNTSYFGDGYYCVKDASNGYFDKDPKDMDLYESTLLAGIPNAPSVYAPTKNPDLAKQRQAQVIDKMISNGYLTEEKAKEIIEVDK